MATMAELVTRLRALTNEPVDAAPYTDAALQAIIESYAIADRLGEDPVLYTPNLDVNPRWVPSYDLNAAAAAVWERKAAVIAQDYDFDAPKDDGSYKRSQVYDQYMAQARYYNSRRSLGSVRVVSRPGATVPLAFNVNYPYE